MNKNNFFESIFNEALDANYENEDGFVFDYVDIDKINPTIPTSVSNVELSYAPFMYRLKYELDGETIVKYIACKYKDLSSAYDVASQDGEIPEGVDLRDHVSLLCSTRNTNNSKPLPMNYKYNVLSNMKSMFPKGYCKSKSEHILKNIEAKKEGHGTVPSEIMDSWMSRAINCPPSEIEYIYEKVGSEAIIIPIKVAYIGYCKELATVCSEIRAKLKKYLKGNNRGSWIFKPGLVRVYDLKEPCILTEYMFSLSPRYEQEHKQDLIHTNDTNVPTYSLSDFTKQQLDDMGKILTRSVEYDSHM